MPLRTGNRLFVALDPGDDLRRELAVVGEQVVRERPGRLVPPENLHLTVAFLGTVPPTAGDALLDDLEAALAGPAARVRLRRVVARPSARGARLVAVELDDLDGAIVALAARVWDAAPGPVAAARPRRSSWPHVTVVRFRRPEGMRGFPPVEGEHVFDITRASLYDSHITPGRPPRYEALMRVRLDGPPAERSSSHG